MQEKDEVIVSASGRGYWVYTCNERPQGRLLMTAPCAIEYILVTRWRGGKKGGQNRVCACDTRDGGVNKKLKREHPSETVVVPESGERKRNLTTLVLVKNAAVKRSRSRQKVSESSQNPLKWSCTAKSTRQGRSSDP